MTTSFGFVNLTGQDLSVIITESGTPYSFVVGSSQTEHFQNVIFSYIFTKANIDIKSPNKNKDGFLFYGEGIDMDLGAKNGIQVTLTSGNSITNTTPPTSPVGISCFTNPPSKIGVLVNVGSSYVDWSLYPNADKDYYFQCHYENYASIKNKDGTITKNSPNFTGYNCYSNGKTNTLFIDKPAPVVPTPEKEPPKEKEKKEIDFSPLWGILKIVILFIGIILFAVIIFIGYFVIKNKKPT